MVINEKNREICRHLKDVYVQSWLQTIDICGSAAFKAGIFFSSEGPDFPESHQQSSKL